MTGRSWTDQPFELLKIRLLDHIARAAADRRIPAVQTYADDLHADARSPAGMVLMAWAGIGATGGITAAASTHSLAS